MYSRSWLHSTSKAPSSPHSLYHCTVFHEGCRSEGCRVGYVVRRDTWIVIVSSCAWKYGMERGWHNSVHCHRWHLLLFRSQAHCKLVKGELAIDRIIKDAQQSKLFLHKVWKNSGLFWDHVHEVPGHASLAFKSGAAQAASAAPLQMTLGHCCFSSCMCHPTDRCGPRTFT